MLYKELVKDERVTINPNQFIQALVDGLQRRMYSMTGAQVKEWIIDASRTAYEQLLDEIPLTQTYAAVFRNG